MTFEQEQAIDSLYSDSRVFEEFRDSVCRGIQNGTLPDIENLTVRQDGVVFLTQPNQETEAYTFTQPAWTESLQSDMSANMEEVSKKLERDAQYLEHYPISDKGIRELCEQAEFTIRVVERGDGVGVEQYRKELLKQLNKGYREADIREGEPTDFEAFRTSALEQYNQVAAQVSQESEIARGRTDSLIQVLRDDVETLKETREEFNQFSGQRWTSEKQEAYERLHEAREDVMMGIHHLKDNFTVATGEIDNGNPELSEQESILEISAKEIGKEYAKEFKDYVDEIRADGPSPLELAEAEDAKEAHKEAEVETYEQMQLFE